MKLARIAIVGGGPGGLYAARLLKLALPDAVVDVHERGDATETFGFGVGLAAATRRNLGEADRETFDDILAATYAHAMSMQVGADLAVVTSGDLRAIGRTTLLEVLQRHARAAGVNLHFHSNARAADLDADLVVVADGVSSATREVLAAELGATVKTSQGLYLWCGTDFALPSALFSPVTTEHGVFVTHAYPYAVDRSTFLIETDEDTWRRAGFDRVEVPEGASDETSLRFLEKAFAQQLQGHRLIGNRTRWLRFRTVHCDRWHHGRFVLLGDAAHTAHYSIGSGTKLAMEDAIALRNAIVEHDDLPTALAAYDAARRAPVAHLQAIAAKSQAWWDEFPERTGLQVDRLLVAYMTRAGKVALERFAEAAPDVVGRALASYAGQAAPPGTDLVSWTLAQPLRTERFETPSRVVDRAKASTADVLLTGAPDRDAVLVRLDEAERVKRTTGKLVAVEAPESLRSDIAAGLVSGRLDLVCWSAA